MDFREKSLQGVLQKNADELARWSAFRDEQMQAIENLYNFQKQLEVEIMVPIGNKALLPGFLYHTNEVMVTHYNGLFSKCTVQKAHEILHSRVEIANDRLRALEAEKEMFVNRQELPGMQDIFSGEAQQEIMEEYDEEKEAEWRKLHRERLREHKQREAADRKAGKVEDEDFDQLMERLEELEMLEEINNELVEEGQEVEECPSQEVLQIKRKSLTFSDQDSVQVIQSHEAPCKAARQPESSLPLNPDLTLHLEVTHSTAVFSPSGTAEITSPADIYRVFGQCLESPDQSEAAVPKSILKNREAVEREIHLPGDGVREAATKKRPAKVVSVDHSAILGDVIERNPEGEGNPDTVDVQKVPKRPISRFKSAREANS
ncbi:unconventional prefoldin RPB5 interactor-like protein [Phlebotomus argentipes]|uniref:unconventional prefoldin RPB5 interactor-like protein n=1 Tax=Phlebotomus argentipes TaxID=94469 RepID=UPI0028933E5D|nr:unconventional prefoldin RPB5 interactor-like protein [Phlebotomus argentipes]